MSEKLESKNPKKLTRREALSLGGIGVVATLAGVAGRLIAEEIDNRFFSEDEQDHCLPMNNRVYTPFESVPAVDNQRVAEIGFAAAVAEQEESCED